MGLLGRQTRLPRRRLIPEYHGPYCQGVDLLFDLNPDRLRPIHSLLWLRLQLQLMPRRPGVFILQSERRLWRAMLPLWRALPRLTGLLELLLSPALTLSDRAGY